MPDDALLTIGSFARSCGLTASALRFYADSGLLRPALVDESSGYRYYAPEQLRRAALIRRLRELEMPLPRIAAVLDAGHDAAAALIDEHLAQLTARAAAAQSAAAAAKAALLDSTEGSGQCEPAGTAELGGTVFAAAVEQVLTATGVEPGLPVLDGVHLEASAGQLALTATDRYRLATRTLTAATGGQAWARTLRADDLRGLTSWLRGTHRLRLRPGPGSVELLGEHGEQRGCRTLDAPFPDYRQLLAALPQPRTRVLLARSSLLDALERRGTRRVRLSTDEAREALSVAGEPPLRLAAEVTGEPITVDFQLATLHPAIASGVGAEAMLEFSRADQPVLVRSADTGDLSTIAMPISPHQTKDEEPRA